MDRLEHPSYRRVMAVFPIYPSYILIEFDQIEYRLYDLSDFLKRKGELFEALSNWDFFRQVKVEDDTIIFPNGLDFDPAMIYEVSKPFDVRTIV